jgi:hypothetical protein
VPLTQTFDRQFREKNNFKVPLRLSAKLLIAFSAKKTILTQQWSLRAVDEADQHCRREAK